jgi:hypothetical protein
MGVSKPPYQKVEISPLITKIPMKKPGTSVMFLKKAAALGK